MPRVKFITTGHSHLAGNFSAGDTYTGDEAACRHFVEDAQCAVWDEVQQVQASGQGAEPARGPSARRTAVAPAAPRTARTSKAAAPAPAVADSVTSAGAEAGTDGVNSSANSEGSAHPAASN